MSAGLRLGAFVAGLAAVFSLAFGLGRALGPVGPASSGRDTHGTHAGTR